MKKSDVLEILDTLSEEFDTEELMYRLYLREKLERSDAAFRAGRVVPHEEVVRRSEAWFR
jgi:hypothetical protein